MRKKIDSLKDKLNSHGSKEDLIEVFFKAGDLSELIPVNSSCSIEYKNLDDLHLVMKESHKKILKLNKKYD